MRTMRRLRNVAFVGLLVTLVWAGGVNLSADSGGYFCGYGDCKITWTDCPGTWTRWSYPDPNAPPNLGDCTVRYQPSGAGCNVNSNVQTEITTGNLYTWSGPEDQGAWFWACYQTMPE